MKKRVLCLFLAGCLAFPTTPAWCDSETEEETTEAEEDGGFLSGIWGAVSGAGGAIAGAAQAAGEAVGGAAAAAGEAIEGAASAVGEAIGGAAAQAWNASSSWVAQVWSDSGDWLNTNWNNFAEWVGTLTSEDPYSWISDMVLEDGIVAYESFAELRSFLKTEPSLDQVRTWYDNKLDELSLLNEDKTVLWDMLQQWANEKSLSVQYAAAIALPFLDRLIIEGSSAIGDDAVFSGPVVGQYLITVLETIDPGSDKAAEEWIDRLESTLEDLTRPVIIGDEDQNVLVTKDGCYMENFTYLDGKYQVFMVVSMKDSDSDYPFMWGKTIGELAEMYFQSLDSEEEEDLTAVSDLPAERLSFTASVSETPITGTALALWQEERNYLFFIVTNGEWNEEEYSAWEDTLMVSDSVSFAVDMESDGSFYGVNQASQKYTINRIFDEEKFTTPKTGHGWAAERGNNLIDNIKGFFKGEHSVVVGDNNVTDGADRVTTYSDGSALLIQSKYYSDASRGIAACFRDGQFRYFDADGNPMAIEVPADQYEAAVTYMMNRISNGEVQGINPAETEKAYEIVKKGNLTYQQAKHIAKAGTVESIAYDSINSCITAGTSMGISAAVTLATNLWSGETFDTAIKSSIYQGLQTGGTSFIISVLASQLSKTGLNTAMIPASRVIAHALGPKVSAVIVNAFRPAGSAIYGAAAMQSAAKLLRGNTITSAVTFVVLSAGDVADIIQGKISWKQLAKNVSVNAAGIAGGTLGFIGGAALGTAILPGVGTAVGIIVSVASGWGASEGADALADMIADDDADEMIAIIEEDFSTIAEEYFLTEVELNQAIENLQTLLTAEMLKEMYQYKDHEEFARQLIETVIDPVVAQRTYVELPSEDEYAEYVVDTLNEIYADIETEEDSSESVQED